MTCTHKYRREKHRLRCKICRAFKSGCTVCGKPTKGKTLIGKPICNSCSEVFH